MRSPEFATPFRRSGPGSGFARLQRSLPYFNPVLLVEDTAHVELEDVLNGPALEGRHEEQQSFKDNLHMWPEQIFSIVISLPLPLSPCVPLTLSPCLGCLVWVLGSRYVFKVEDVSFSLWRRRGKTKQAGNEMVNAHVCSAVCISMRVYTCLYVRIQTFVFVRVHILIHCAHGCCIESRGEACMLPYMHA